MMPSEDEQSGSGAAIAVGALLDGVPESVVLGLGLVGGGSVNGPVLAAVSISNVPEGLSSAAGMKATGRSVGYVFGVWGGIPVAKRRSRAGRVRGAGQRFAGGGGDHHRRRGRLDPHDGRRR